VKKEAELKLKAEADKAAISVTKSEYVQQALRFALM